MSNIETSHGFIISAHLLNNTDNTNTDISKYVEDVMVRKRFLSDVMPLVIIDLKATEAIRNEIRDDDCNIKLRISYFSLNNANSAEFSESMIPAEEGVVLESIIRIFEKPFTTTLTKDNLNENKEFIESNSQAFYYRISGVPEDIIMYNEDSINSIFKDCEVADVLVNIFSGINEEFKFQETVNKEIYENILIPPLSISESVDFLDSTYTIYDKPANLFFDFNKSYLYAPNSSKRPSTNIIDYSVISSNASELVDSSALIVDGNNIKIKSKSIPNASISKEIVSYVRGTDRIYYTYDEFFDISFRNKKTVENFKKTRYIWNPNSEKNYEDLNYSLSDNTTSLSLMLYSLNPELITPLTKFNLKSEEYKNLNGEYFISEVYYILKTNNFKYYTDSILLTCNKLKK